MTKQAKIVTKQSLQALLADEAKRPVVIGRALSALFERQVESEKETNDTHVTNNLGFSSADARQGSITAKTFRKRGTLLEFQVEYWMKARKDGSPRICKYHRQLNEIAMLRRLGSEQR